MIQQDITLNNNPELNDTTYRYFGPRTDGINREILYEESSNNIKNKIQKHMYDKFKKQFDMSWKLAKSSRVDPYIW